MSSAAKLHSSGDLEGARRAAEAALGAGPGHILALRMLGLFHCEAGEPRVGVSYFTQALELDPSDMPTRVNAVQAALDADRPADAARIGAEAVETSGDLLRLRAAAAHKLGRTDEAVALLLEATESASDDYASWNNLGNALHDAGRSDEAIVALERARALKPDDPQIAANLRRVLVATGRSGDALAALADAVVRNPESASAHYDLAQALRAAGDDRGALQAIGRAAALDRGNADIFAEMGVIFGNLNELGRAEQAFRMALSLDPAHPRAYLNLGIMLEQANRLEELRVLLIQPARPATRGDERRFLGALLMRREGKLEEALQLAQATDPGGTVDPQTLAHLVGQLADRLERPALAFESFENMHAAAAQTAAGRRFTGREAADEIRAMTKSVTSGLMTGWVASPNYTKATPAPVFLVGFLRSGTTLLDTMLMGHPGIHVLEEEPILATLSQDIPDLATIVSMDADHAARLRTAYFDEVAKVATVEHGRLLVDKNPLASLRAPLIHRLFPHARFIFALRHPCDVVLSCFMQNFKINRAMASFLTLENAALYYDAVMDFWHRCQDALPLKVHTVRYEALVMDQEAELRALTRFLDVPWTGELLDHEATAVDRGYIRTPSYAQVTERVYDRAKGRWERYRDQLEPIFPILAPWVERFGYAPLDA